MKYVDTSTACKRLSITMDVLRYAMRSGRIRNKLTGGRRMVDTSSYKLAIEPPEGYITVDEYAKISGLSHAVIYKKCTNGDIDNVKDGRHVYIHVPV